MDILLYQNLNSLLSLSVYVLITNRRNITFRQTTSPIRSHNHQDAKPANTSSIAQNQHCHPQTTYRRSRVKYYSLQSFGICVCVFNVVFSNNIPRYIRYISDGLVRSATAVYLKTHDVEALTEMRYRRWRSSRTIQIGWMVSSQFYYQVGLCIQNHYKLHIHTYIHTHNIHTQCTP